jgi:hypothetical protein
MPTTGTGTGTPITATGLGRTRAQVIARAKAILEEGVGSVLGAAGSADWLELANLAHKRVCRDSKCLKNSEEVTTVADQVEYSLGGTIFEITEVWHDDAPLDPATARDLMLYDYRWRTAPASGKPSYFLREGPASSMKLTLYPAPSTAYASDTVTVVGYAIPGDFAGDSDRVALPPPYDDLVVNRLVIEAAKHMASDPLARQKMFDAEREYREEVEKLKALIRWPAGRRLVRGTLNVSRAEFPPRTVPISIT